MIIFTTSLLASNGIASSCTTPCQSKIPTDPKPVSTFIPDFQRHQFPVHLFLEHLLEQHMWLAVHGLSLTLHAHVLDALLHTSEQQLLADAQAWPRTVQVGGVGVGGAGP